MPILDGLGEGLFRAQPRDLIGSIGKLNVMSVVITSYEMKQFIIDTLGLEDLTPEGIGDEEPLFAGGLGLDSIDALELGIALRKAFRVPAAEQDPATRDQFRTVSPLVGFVARSGQPTLEARA